MEDKIKILLLEDSSNDAEIIQRFLLKQHLPCQFLLTTGEASFTKALQEFSPQVILSDNSMPGFSAIEALRLTRQEMPDIPFIMVTGTVSEEFAANIIKQGADDYILKDRMSRLPAAIEAALKQRKAEKEKKRIEAELQKSNDRFQYATEASSDIIWELDFETSEYMVHDGRKKLTGFNKIPDWQLGIDGKFVSPSDKKRIATSFHNAQITPACDLWREEYRVFSAENNLQYITNHAIFIRNEKGEPLKAIGAITDITEKRQLEMELIEQARNEQLKIIATAVEAQEKERHAIGLELHDNVNQILLGTKLLLSFVKTDPTKNVNLINDCLLNITKAIEENRKIAHVLVIPDFNSISLKEQLYSLADSMFNPAGIKVVLDTNDIDEALLETRIKLSVYRIAQEQCTNIIKYAAAKNVHIGLRVTGKVFKMFIADDGKGADANKKTNGIGLNNIRGRLSILDGTVHIHTAPGKGFKLEIELPVIG